MQLYPPNVTVSHWCLPAGMFEWIKYFKGSRGCVGDDGRSNRTSSCTAPKMIARVHEITVQCPRQTAGYLRCLTIRRISAKFVSQLLSNDQQDRTELSEAIADNPLYISKISTGDETWVYGYDLETRYRSSQ